MKKVLVDESLLETAAIAVEQANIYLNALRVIGKTVVVTEEGRKLVKIAIDAVKNSHDTEILSQEEFPE